MDAVEVVARLGSTILSITHLRAGETYRIGTAPGVDLPLTVATTFPLVERGVVRIPAGITATVFEAGRARPLAGRELWLAARVRVELRIGLVAISIARVTVPQVPVPRPPPDRRPPAYAIASLGLHLTVWLLAVAIAPFREPLERLPPQQPVRVTHVAEPPAEPTREPTPVPTATAATAAPSAAPPPAGASATSRRGRRRRAVAEAREAGILGADGLSDLTMLAPKAELEVALDGAGPVYDEDAAASEGFGGHTRWDPGGTIPTGPYRTMSDGHGAGDDYDLLGSTVDTYQPMVAMCTGRPCATEGPVANAIVAQVIATRSRDLLRCYRQLAQPQSRGTVTLDFEIDRDGAVLRASGRGFGEVAPCVVAVLEKIDFPIAPAQTTVKFSLGFR